MITTCKICGIGIDQGSISGHKCNIRDIVKHINKLEGEVERLKEKESQFWKYLPELYSIESKEEFEKEMKNWEPKNALVVALHYIWKRDPKVAKLRKALDDIKKLLCRDATPKWSGGLATTRTRGVIADICDGAINGKEVSKAGESEH